MGAGDKIQLFYNLKMFHIVLLFKINEVMQLISNIMENRMKISQHALSFTVYRFSLELHAKQSHAAMVRRSQKLICDNYISM